MSAASVRVGDKVLLSGSIGDHGMAVMLARGTWRSRLTYVLTLLR
ncbi:hydrogenase maturation factor, HypE domain protein [Mycobacterium xenopi 4042]|uniref:Hydrogenase maturation factor, HypE domain protein n=1 Tax=Mycobacterium xenopi 4042 TaxID=1299334 RepID=X7ZWD0_MYCXE|nr:hydrogenase maturation factor, HypE domain protein [Mycobacterium xenopi 4042]